MMWASKRTLDSLNEVNKYQTECIRLLHDRIKDIEQRLDMNNGAFSTSTMQHAEQLLEVIDDAGGDQ